MTIFLLQYRAPQIWIYPGLVELLVNHKYTTFNEKQGKEHDKN